MQPVGACNMTSTFTTLGDEHTFTMPTVTVPFDRASMYELVQWFAANGYARTNNSYLIPFAEGPGWRIDIYFRQYQVQITDEKLAMLFSLRWS